jgi:hypothetical protein
MPASIVATIKKQNKRLVNALALIICNLRTARLSIYKSVESGESGESGISSILTSCRAIQFSKEAEDNNRRRSPQAAAGLLDIL